MRIIKVIIIIAIPIALIALASSKLIRATSPSSGTVVVIGEMNEPRFAHTSTLLSNGLVLITGGQGTGTLASAEIYDPDSHSFSIAGKMNESRAGHSATLLRNGKVLITGGFNGTYLQSAEIYDPETRQFSLTSQMITARSGHEAVMLNNGKVLLAGGAGTGWTFLPGAEIYDPETGMFSPTGNMNEARESHTATLLKNGKVVITGGHKDRRSDITLYSSTELYDPLTGKFSFAGDMTMRRHKHDATLLSDGSILIVGGSDERDRDGAYSSAEIYDPGTGQFEAVSKMNFKRYKLRGTSILLPDGKVLITGGSSSAELFDPSIRRFIKVEGSMETDRLFATATLLLNNNVLITGGYDERMFTSSKAWLYQH